MVDAGFDANEIEVQRKALRSDLSNYNNSIPSAQRQFAMRELQRMFPDAKPFSTAQAERIALQAVAAKNSSLITFPNHTSHERVYSVRPSRESRVVLLFIGERLQNDLTKLVSPWSTSNDAMVAITRSANKAADVTTAKLPLSHLPEWELSIRSSDPTAFEAASRHQTALYFLASAMTIVAVVVGVAGTAWFVRRQLRLAQLKNDLAAVVTHELRTPLASIRVLVDTLLDDDPIDATKTRDYLQLISQENERLSRLIENFLTFSRLERNQQRFSFSQVAPAELATGAVNAVNGKLSETNCAFSVDVESDLPSIQADVDAVVTVLTNLLDNAVKFTEQEKQVALNVNRDNGFIKFAVEDNGIGMSSAEARRVFDRFFQADTRLSRSHGGCGLGLSLVRSIVDAHKGTVDVSSTPGVGSIFTVRLPIVHQERSED